MNFRRARSAVECVVAVLEVPKPCVAAAEKLASRQDGACVCSGSHKQRWPCGGTSNDASASASAFALVSAAGTAAGACQRRFACSGGGGFIQSSRFCVWFGKAPIYIRISSLRPHKQATTGTRGRYPHPTVSLSSAQRQLTSHRLHATSRAVADRSAAACDSPLPLPIHSEKE